MRQQLGKCPFSDEDDVGEDDDDSTDPLDADPVGDWQSDDERRVGEDRQHVAQQSEKQALAVVDKMCN